MRNTQVLPAEFGAISALDFTDIKAKICKKLGWSPEQADIAEMWYKRFLAIRAKYPEARLVPNNAIDEIWHAHILDTRRYANDCQKCFGYFLHHAPSYGRVNHQPGFDETNAYYRLEFGEDCTEMFEGIATCGMEDKATCDMAAKATCDMAAKATCGMEDAVQLNLVMAAECDDTDGGQADQN